MERLNVWQFGIAVFLPKLGEESEEVGHIVCGALRLIADVAFLQAQHHDAIEKIEEGTELADGDRLGLLPRLCPQLDDVGQHPLVAGTIGGEVG